MINVSVILVKNFEVVMNKQMLYAWINHVVGLLMVIAILATAVLARDGKLFNVSQDDFFVKNSDSNRQTNIITAPNSNDLSILGIQNQELKEIKNGIWATDNNEIIISSTPFASDVVGFAGATPLFIALRNDTIIGICDQANNETPSFWSSVVEHGNLKAWNNLSIQEAINTKADALSGATFSSNAINETVALTLSGIKGENFANYKWEWNWKRFTGLLIIIISIITSLIIKKKQLRIIQLILNVLVLGLYCGSFISISLVMGWLSNGVHIAASLVTLTMVIIAIIMPFFGKKRFYCYQICPFGSAQELVGMCRKNKRSISPKLIKILNLVRQLIFIIIVALMWTGIYFNAINYEVFSIFVFSQASWIVIALASIFLILSLFINRPYCRFVCPTGTMLQWQEKIGK